MVKAKKAQGALEYLILIGAAVFIGAVVILVLGGQSETLKCENTRSSWASLCSTKTAYGQTICENTNFVDPKTGKEEGPADCVWNATEEKCELANDPATGAGIPLYCSKT